MDFAALAAGEGFRPSHSFVRALHDGACFIEGTPGVGESRCSRAAVERRQAETFLQVANLPAQQGLREAKALRRRLTFCPRQRQ